MLRSERRREEQASLLRISFELIGLSNRMSIEAPATQYEAFDNVN